MSALLVTTRRAPSRHIISRDARVYGRRTTAMHKLSTTPWVCFYRGGVIQGGCATIRVIRWLARFKHIQALQAYAYLYAYLYAYPYSYLYAYLKQNSPVAFIPSVSPPARKCLRLRSLIYSPWSTDDLAWHRRNGWYLRTINTVLLHLLIAALSREFSEVVTARVSAAVAAGKVVLISSLLSKLTKVYANSPRSDTINKPVRFLLLWCAKSCLFQPCF